MQKTSRPIAPRQRRTLAVTLLTAVLAAASSAHAANTTWVGNTDANFGTLANWNAVTPDGNSPFFGAAGTSGTTLNNDLSGATYFGLVFNSGASAYTIGGNSFTLATVITNNSGSLQTINNAITLTTATHTFSAASGDIALGGAFSGATGSVTFSGPGTTTLSGTNTFNTNQGNFGALSVGSGSGTSPTAGNLSITGATTVTSTGSASTSGGSLVLVGNSTLTIQTGGSLLIDSVVSSGGNSIIGQNATGTSTLRVNGGTLTVNGAQGFAIGNNRSDTTGVLTIDSGTATINRGSTTVTDARSYIALGRDTANGTINLNGGILATDRNFVRDGAASTGNGGTANFVFGGGTLKALAAQTDWLKSTTTNTYLQALSSVTTTSANSTIDSNSFSVAINSAISGSGGFHITDTSVAGTGIVHFGGASYAYTGATSVDSGTFNTNAASVAFSGNLAVAGGTLTLNGSGTGSVSTTGFTMSSGTWTVSIGDTISTSGNMSITGGTLDVAAFSGSEETYSSTGYTLFSSISGTSSVTGLAITGYDTTNYTASLSDAGVLTFATIPEPSTYAALAGVLALGTVITRRRSR